MGGAQFSLDRPSGLQGLGAQPVAPAGAPRDEGGALPPIQEGETAHEAAERGTPAAPAGAAKREEGVGTTGGKDGDTIIARATKTRGRKQLTVVANNAECTFDELRLDEAYETGIQALGEDEEVVALMPAKEFVIAHGPKRTVLYWLCGDVKMTEKINGFFEGQSFFHQHPPRRRHAYCQIVFPKTSFWQYGLVLGNTVLLLVDTGKGFVSTTFIWKTPLNVHLCSLPNSLHAYLGVKALCSYLVLFSGPLTLVAMTEAVKAVPYELTWLAILFVPDTLRKLFKLNVEAITLIVCEVDYWVTFVTLCLAVVSAAVSFEYDGAAVYFLINFVFKLQ